MNNLLPFSSGFELEFELHDPGTLGVIAAALQSAGYQADNFGAWRRTPVSTTRWDLKTDRSCGVEIGVVGYEAVSPVIFTQADLERHAKVAPLIYRTGGRLNDRCGFHVHMGFAQHADHGHEALQRVFRFLTRYERAFYMLVPPDRRQNPYCKPMDPHLVEEVKRTSGNLDIASLWTNKNTWVNFQTLRRIGTIEFRLFPGTLSKDDIVGAVLFLQQVLSAVVCAKKEVQWGRGSAKDDRMLFYTMLQQAGFYDKREDFSAVARKWAITQFRKNKEGLVVSDQLSERRQTLTPPTPLPTPPSSRARLRDARARLQDLRDATAARNRLAADQAQRDAARIARIAERVRVAEEERARLQPPVPPAAPPVEVTGGTAGCPATWIRTAATTVTAPTGITWARGTSTTTDEVEQQVLWSDTTAATTAAYDWITLDDEQGPNGST